MRSAARLPVTAPINDSRCSWGEMMLIYAKDEDRTKRRRKHGLHPNRGFPRVLSIKISCRSCANPVRRLRRQTHTGWWFKQTSSSEFLDKYKRWFISVQNLICGNITFLKTDSLSCYTKNTLRLGTMSYLFWCPWSLAQCLAQSRRYYKCLCTTQKCAFFFSG